MGERGCGRLDLQEIPAGWWWESQGAPPSVSSSCRRRWERPKSLSHHWPHFWWWICCQFHDIINLLFLSYFYLVLWMDKNLKSKMWKGSPTFVPVSTLSTGTPSKWLTVGSLRLYRPGGCAHRCRASRRTTVDAAALRHEAGCFPDRPRVLAHSDIPGRVISSPSTLFYSFLFHLTISPEGPSMLIWRERYYYLTAFWLMGVQTVYNTFLL